jgi:hypothetical protein
MHERKKKIQTPLRGKEKGRSPLPHKMTLSGSGQRADRLSQSRTSIRESVREIMFNEQGAT